jgi:hypothetical protein
MTQYNAEKVKKLSKVLDDLIKIPGTNISIGIDGILGLLPGVGDGLSSLLSFYIVYQAAVAGVPIWILFRMIINICIDTLLGAVPVFGDIFDIVWRSNIKNVELIKAVPDERLRPRTGSQIRKIMAVIFSAFFITLLILTVLLVRLIWQSLA